jgi:predicted enzyme related to lactoylglutathione lyase
MQISRQVVVFDAPDLTAESDFWAGVMKGVVDKEDDWHMVIVDGKARIGVQLAPDHVRPQWPGGPERQQIHLDLYVDDLTAAHDEVTALGATLLQAADDPEAKGSFQVYADPAGHPFCLCLLRP